MLIEETVRRYLAPRLGVPVLYGNPDPAKAGQRYVVIERTGGGEEEHVASATFAIQSYAESVYEAATLNDRLKDAMEGIAELPQVSHAGLNSDYEFSDEERKQYRYQAVYDMVYYRD